MAPQDPNPMIWGAMDRFQVHCILHVDENCPGDMLARTNLVTQGRFAEKRVVSASWSGSRLLARRLNDDQELNEMIAEQNVEDATIFVEPTEGMVRIHGKWKNHLEFGITPEMFRIYDRIAGHVKFLDKHGRIENCK